ncbi:MAG TPA: DNA-3-methyladenine glycosylase [Micromonosporaceae bacterium]|nr:DNA-3-methyladenine glycosylase [Micromonosporaceae bacterium]
MSLLTLLCGPVDAAARGLLGCTVSAGGVTVRLTEVEAYTGAGTDPASHAHRGRTPRNEVMFGPPGHAYVYFIFGMHWCVNLVCGEVGRADAVLLRAGTVTAGVEVARLRRPGVRADRELARGPGRLALALGVDGGANGTSMVDGSGPMTLTSPRRPVGARLIRSGPRVGVAAAAEVAWRFWLDGEPSVSAYRRHVRRRRHGAVRTDVID